MIIHWLEDFTVVAAEASTLDALKRVLISPVGWVIVERHMDKVLRYVFSRREFLGLIHNLPAETDHAALPLGTALDLHEYQASNESSAYSAVIYTPPPRLQGPSATRLVRIHDGRPVAVGIPESETKSIVRNAPESDIKPIAPSSRFKLYTLYGLVFDFLTYLRRRFSRKIHYTMNSESLESAGSTEKQRPSMGVEEVYQMRRASRNGDNIVSHDALILHNATDEVANAMPFDDDDEGVTPQRFPSIEADTPIIAGKAITLIVDLKRKEVEHTLGGFAPPQLEDEWQHIKVDVILQSPAIEFEAGGVGTVTIRRNSSSDSARILGRIVSDLKTGNAVEVKARFLVGNRFCGSAARRFTIIGADQSQAPSSAVATIQVDTRADAPDLTVFITSFDNDAPGALHWRMVTLPFDGRPPRMDGRIDLGREPGVQATALFSRIAKLERGQHRQDIQGFGQRLWNLAPQAFRDTYWALHDHYRRRLTIQFISDDPHLPWELMRPNRNDETHQPLALEHAVARWIGRYQGWMTNRLRSGSLFAMAPRYNSASTRLKLAEKTTQALEKELGFTRLPGTREQFLNLLENPPPDPVALLYFTGHGAFAVDSADASLLKLEDGQSITSLAIERNEVRLGERWGTVVFLNACEVGATGSVLGNVGGWADAFLSRRFGAFIAPLWAIDEEDAQQATETLMTRILRDGIPLGEALRELRVQHGDISPTFYSYLLFGDVTAQLGNTRISVKTKS